LGSVLAVAIVWFTVVYPKDLENLESQLGFFVLANINKAFKYFVGFVEVESWPILFWFV
jgi:hypothetical protein